MIIVSDAGCNNGHFEFSALADSIRMIRERHGIAIVDLDNERPADVSSLRRDKNVQPMHHICFRIVYPARDDQPESIGLLVYAQMSLTGREPLDLQQFRKLHPDFPDEPITNQFFDARQVESYRQLGYHVGRTVSSQLHKSEATNHRRDTSAVMRALVRGYLADFASNRKDKDCATPCGFAGIDLFEMRKLWCPRLPPASVERFVSEQISKFLTHRVFSLPTRVELVARFGGCDADAKLAKRLSKASIALLRLHGNLVGNPTADIFQPGGRRIMIRALTTIVYFQRIQTTGVCDSHIVRRRHAISAAWCVLSHSVFSELGTAAAAEFLSKRTCDDGEQFSRMRDKLKANLQECFEKGRIGEIHEYLWSNPTGPRSTDVVEQVFESIPPVNIAMQKL